MSVFPQTTNTASHDKFTLFIEGDDLYQAMLEDIASAQDSIQLESYIFAYDEIGESFITALTERVRAGVSVQIHLDAAGAMFLRNGYKFQKLRQYTIQLRWFHRWSWRRPFRYNRRNHRKLLVIDKNITYVGGFNIHRESSKHIFGNQRWRDTHLRIVGSLADHASELFNHFWQGNHHWLPPSYANDNCLLVPNNTHDHRFQLRNMLETIFTSAQQSIFLTTPYFVPDRHTQRLLQSAAKNGIDVRLLVPRKSDIPLARWAAHAAYDALLNSGVRIYEYLPRMLHSKTIIVDANYATLGTANLDYRSFFLNYELNIFTKNSELCQQLQEQFYIDLKLSDEIYLHKWKYRFWGDKILEFIGWLARRWL